MNTVNWIPDLFMQRVRGDGDWTLFSPDEVPDLHDSYGQNFKQKYEQYERDAAEGKMKIYKTIKARRLWQQMVTMLFETGHPWMTFKDPCNVRSPQDHVGVVHSSNLCTEITLNNSEDETAVCNLGSVNLKQHILPSGELDWELMEQTIHLATRMLDNVIDLNFYPTEETKRSNMRHRPVGMGMMGLQDALYAADKPYDSAEGLAYNDQIMEFVSYHAILGSSKLAKDKGTYETYKGSKWDRGLLPYDTIALMEQERGDSIPVDKTMRMDWTPVREHIAEHGMRNSNTMAIAPTSNIGLIGNAVRCIEPIYKNLFVMSNMGGEFTWVNEPLIADLKAAGVWDSEMLKDLKIHDGSLQQIDRIPQVIKNKYKEVFELNPKYIVDHAALRAKWLDQSQSVNLFYRGTSGREISELYQYAWKMGLKTTYYLRTLGATQVEKATVATTQSTNSRVHESSMTTAPAADPSLTAAEKMQEKQVMCSILNGEECEACQ